MSQPMSPSHTMRRARGTLAALSAAAMLVAAFGVNAAPAPKAPAPVKVSTGPSGGMQVTTQSAPVATKVLNLPKGRSAVIDLPVDASDVFVSNPAVADAVLRTPRRIFVLGVAPGSSDAIFFDGMGRQILNLSIRVDAPTDGLSDTVSRLFPKSKVEVQSLNGHVVLSGMATNAGEADQILRLAQSLVEKPEDVVNLMAVAGKDQVALKVRIVEVERSMIKQLGLTTDIVYDHGTVAYGYQRANSFGSNGSYLGSKGLCYGEKPVVANVGMTNATCLEAFERAGLSRTLAEPNLTAVSGESAKFLAGGEFPVPVAQDNQGRITVEFKPFGVGLGFTPVVLSNGRISLKLSTEVSELTNTGSFSLNNSFTIPALNVRRAETTVEMQSGSTLMIAGLLLQKYKSSIDSMPGLTSLPILGALFRSRDFLNDETEMVVLVTPYIVSPTDPDSMQTPADNLIAAHDMSAVFMGRINKVITARNGDTASAAPPAPYQAPIGYVIE
jgi:pilus assembly protein CpaC